MSFLNRTILAATLIVAGSAAQATTLFSGDFDAENGGASALDYAGFARFSVATGTVDLIASGDFGLSCLGGTGSCVDMDGSSGSAGRLTSTPIALLGGTEYELSFAVSGNQRGGASDSMSFGVTSGQLATETITKTPFEGFESISRTFTTTGPGNFSIFFDHAGGDNIGLILDQVALTMVGIPAIPLPAALPTLAGALVLLGAVRRRA